jgi:hypothetical protein
MTEKQIAQLCDDYKKEKDRIDTPLEKIIEQIKTFEKGIPYLKLVRPCTKGDGITLIDEDLFEVLISEYQLAVDEGRITKFVPASGAASRMFKKLQTVLVNSNEIKRDSLESAASNEDADSKAVLEFVDNLKRFAFYSDLKEKMTEDGLDIEVLLNEKNYFEILKYTLEPDGLNYVNQPKGSIKFHNYPDGSRTAFEEHLQETIDYAMGRDKTAKVHFTISPEYRELANLIINRAIENHQNAGNEIEVSFSYQKTSTDTIAVTKENIPFKDAEGNLVSRPAGHGALLENLNDLNGDIIVIKNIDNIVPDQWRKTTILYKKVLAGFLISLQNKIFSYLNNLDKEKNSPSTINSIFDFAKSELSLYFDENFLSLTTPKQIQILKEKLNVPVRVCGMVKDEGHAGGGPFWVKDTEGIISPQIVEMTQIDCDDKEQLRIMEKATHFNPVDLVCGVRDYKGREFNLLEYIDPDSGLITTKSKDGKELKALELPGLWNGSMAKWITVFVEVPRITFNPVKEVNDLLRKEHQPISNEID